MKYYVRRKTCKLKTNFIYHKMYTCFFLNSRPRKRGECRCRGLDLTQNHLKMEKKTKKEEKKRKKKNCARSGI